MLILSIFLRCITLSSHIISSSLSLRVVQTHQASSLTPFFLVEMARTPLEAGAFSAKSLPIFLQKGLESLYGYLPFFIPFQKSLHK